MEKKEIQWDSFSDVLTDEKNYNILEEEIDIAVQRDFFQLSEKLIDDSQNLHTLSIEYMERINDLFSDEISDNEKKEMLLVLSTLDKVDVYRSIESFAQLDTPLKSWATIALQQSRMLIQSSLLEEDTGIFISTGLGGHDGLLRYFCVFVNKENEYSDFQKNILFKETETAVLNQKGQVETFEYNENLAQAFVLLPLKINLKEIFQGVINECNLYGDFLRDDMIITNVKRLSGKEISSILKERALNTNL